MCKNIIAFIFLLTSVCFVVHGQNNNNVLECDNFFKQVYEVGKCRLFDLRTPEEYKKSRLVDAELADTKEKFMVFLKEMEKQDKIFIYCEIGKRTQQCAKWLYSLGYNNVFLLDGGFRKWKINGFPIDSEIIKM